MANVFTFIHCPFIQIKHCELVFIGTRKIQIIQNLFAEILTCLWMHDKLIIPCCQLLFAGCSQDFSRSPGSLEWIFKPLAIQTIPVQKRGRGVFNLSPNNPSLATLWLSCLFYEFPATPSLIHGQSFVTPVILMFWIYRLGYHCRIKYSRFSFKRHCSNFRFNLFPHSRLTFDTQFSSTEWKILKQNTQGALCMMCWRSELLESWKIHKFQRQIVCTVPRYKRNTENQ